MKTTILNNIFVIFASLFFLQCSRADEEMDVLAQEEISNVILVLQNEQTQEVKQYNYTLNSINDPLVQVQANATYKASIIFMGGAEDLTEEIVEERDEHFVTFQFIGAQIDLIRTDAKLRADGNRVGLESQWKVISVDKPAQLKLNLYHDPAEVNEAKEGSTYGTVKGGETDAEATYDLTL